MGREQPGLLPSTGRLALEREGLRRVWAKPTTPLVQGRLQTES